MNSNTVCDGSKPWQHCKRWQKNGSSVFAMNGSNTGTVMSGGWEKQIFAVKAAISETLAEWLGVTDNCCEGSDICIPG